MASPSEEELTNVQQYNQENNIIALPVGETPMDEQPAAGGAGPSIVSSKYDNQFHKEEGGDSDQDQDEESKFEDAPEDDSI